MQNFYTVALLTLIVVDAVVRTTQGGPREPLDRN